MTTSVSCVTRATTGISLTPYKCSLILGQALQLTMSLLRSHLLFSRCRTKEASVSLPGMGRSIDFRSRLCTQAWSSVQSVLPYPRLSTQHKMPLCCLVEQLTDQHSHNTCSWCSFSPVQQCYNHQWRPLHNSHNSNYWGSTLITGAHCIQQDLACNNI